MMLFLLLLSILPDMHSTLTVLRHMYWRISTFIFSVRRNQLPVNEAIKLLKGATWLGVGIVLYSAASVWQYDTVAGRLVFGLSLAVAAYIIMGTRGTVELLLERRQWVTAQRMIDLT